LGEGIWNNIKKKKIHSNNYGVVYVGALTESEDETEIKSG